MFLLWAARSTIPQMSSRSIRTSQDRKQYSSRELLRLAEAIGHKQKAITRGTQMAHEKVEE